MGKGGEGGGGEVFFGAMKGCLCVCWECGVCVCVCTYACAYMHVCLTLMGQLQMFMLYLQL